MRNMKSIARSFVTVIAAVTAGIAWQGTEAASAKKLVKPATTTTTAATTTTVAATPAVVPELAGGHEVNAEATIDPSTVTSPGEQCVVSGSVAKGVCVRIGLLSFPITGDISGSTVWASSNYYVPSNPSVVGFSGAMEIENANVAGCGVGTIVLLFGPAPIGTKSPTGNPFPGFWRIVVKSQSSPLANVQGQGLLWADSLGPGPVKTHFNGMVKC